MKIEEEAQCPTVIKDEELELRKEKTKCDVN